MARLGGAARGALGITLAWVLAWAFAPRAAATVVESVGLEELSACADLIVEARVVGSTTRLRERRGHMVPFTFHRLAPIEVLYGQAAREILVREPGGSTAQGTTTLVGAPRYLRGERVLAFLANTEQAQGELRTCWMAQGKFTIEEQAGMAIARRDLGELALIPRGTDPLAAHAGESPWEVTELKRLVRQLVSDR